ncbi:MAG TPA: ABC transporter permease [Blastocatellia bacterium]|jgi:ribose transport system permease protein|nr:ABC transporter permease [Blastocatellia bacterium]
MADKLSSGTAVSRTWKAASSKSGVVRKELGTGLLLVVLCIVVTILDPRFLGGANLQNMARLIGAFGIFSIGVGVVIISGGIDLSVGSIFALLGVLLSMMLTQGRWPGILAVTVVMAIAMCLGLAHGLLVTRVRLQPFVVTLCGLLLYRGLARFIANDETKGFGNAEGFEGLRTLATGSVLGVPTPFLLLMIVSFVMWVVVHRSVYGRHLFAVGRNEEAARYSGINSSLVTACAYVISGLLAGVASVVFAFYTNSISPSTHGSFYELYGIAAAVLGGCSLRGGEGSIAGILIGTALLQVLQNLVNLLGVPSSLNFAVMGAVILIGAVVDEILKRRSAKTSSRRVETSPSTSGSQEA